MLNLTHVQWTNNFEVGVVAVKRKRDYINFTCIQGPKPKADLILTILNAALKEGWIDEAESLHKNRFHSWKVEQEIIFKLDSYKLRLLKNKYLCDTPVVSYINIETTTNCVLNFNIWLGNLPPLLNSIIRKYGVSLDVYINTYNPNPSDLKDYNQPGSDSGLKELFNDF